MAKALVVDDSLVTRVAISKMLSGMGFDSLQAVDGKEALGVLAQNRDVTLALVDWNMPVMSGIDFVREVRKDSTYQHLKIIMVTAETEMTEVVSALEAGIDEYIMKPFTKEIFDEKLALLGVHRG